MSSSQLFRLSGLAAIFGGLFIISARALQVFLYHDNPLSVHAADPLFVLALGIPGLFGSILFTLGALGLYARQAGRLGRIGALMFVVAFIGLLLSTGANWAYAFVAPFLAQTSPGLLDQDFTAPGWGVMGTGFLFSYLFGAVSWLLMGVLTMLGGVLPRWVGGVMLGSMLLAFTLPLSTNGVEGILVNFLLALGPISFGYVLWSE